MLGHVQRFVTLWTVARQAPLSRDFSGKNTGMGGHFPWMERGCLIHLCIPCGPARPSSHYSLDLCLLN